MSETRTHGNAWRWMIVLAMVAMGGFACGPVIDDQGGGGTGGAGAPPVCYSDPDCVPDACCGQGSGAVPASSGPSCGGVVCTGSCPVNEVRCGCGLPVCRDGQCMVAVTVGQGC